MARGGRSGFLHVDGGKNLIFLSNLEAYLQRCETEAAFWDYIQLVSSLQHIRSLFYTEAEAVNATEIKESFL